MKTKTYKMTDVDSPDHTVCYTFSKDSTKEEILEWFLGVAGFKVEKTKDEIDKQNAVFVY